MTPSKRARAAIRRDHEEEARKMYAKEEAARRSCGILRLSTHHPDTGETVEAVPFTYWRSPGDRYVPLARRAILGPAPEWMGRGKKRAAPKKVKVCRHCGKENP